MRFWMKICSLKNDSVPFSPLLPSPSFSIKKKVSS